MLSEGPGREKSRITFFFPHECSPGGKHLCQLRHHICILKTIQYSTSLRRQWASVILKMVQWVKDLVAKPEDLSPIPGTHVMGENRLLKGVL